MENVADVPSADADAAKMYVWLKSVESKANNLSREVDLLKNDLVRKNNDLRKEVKGLTDDLLEIRQEQEKTLKKMDLIVSELRKTAGAEEVMVLKKYIDLWNPLHFVTQRDLDRAIRSRMETKEDGKDLEKGIDYTKTNKKEQNIPFM